MTSKLQLAKDIFDFLPVQKFLDANPEYTERIVYGFRDEILHQLKLQAVNEAGEQKKVYSLYVDGASQESNTKGGIGGVIYLNDSEIESFSENIGPATNNEAEYTALLRGLAFLEKYQPDEVYIFADSELMVKQINGEYKVRNERLAKLYEQVIHLLDRLEDWNIEHVPRERNKEADKLSKQALMKERR
jgi:ribonuclease HI